MKQFTGSVGRCVMLLTVLCASAAWADASPEKAPTPPSEAQWTIRCRIFTGPNRIADSMQARDFLRKQTREKTWYLLHGESETTLYYGYYRSVQVDGSEGKDRRDAERAHADRKRIAALRDERGQAAFSEAFFVPVDAVGEDGPREWNIVNAPDESCWSLLIGVYRDTPERKRGAVDAVKKLRSEKVEAYYFHGDLMSYVFVGRWDANAIVKETVDTSKVSQSDNEEVMVTDRWLDPTVPSVYRGPNGKTVRLVNPTLSIRDQNVKELMARYPHFHTNGEVMGRKVRDKKTQEERVVYDQSVLMAIPRREQNIFSADRPSGEPAVRLIQPPGIQSKPAGSGRLKSLDE